MLKSSLFRSVLLRGVFLAPEYSIKVEVSMGVDWRFERFHIVHNLALGVYRALLDGAGFTIGYAAKYSHRHGVFV